MSFIGPVSAGASLWSDSQRVLAPNRGTGRGRPSSEDSDGTGGSNVVEEAEDEEVRK